MEVSKIRFYLEKIEIAPCVGRAKKFKPNYIEIFKSIAFFLICFIQMDVFGEIRSD